MDYTASISKGCFISTPKRTKYKKRNDFSIIFSQPWYRAYKELWTSINSKIQRLNQDISANLINDIVNYVSDRDFEDSHIQTVILFTGINLPDHDTLYETLCSNLENKLNCRVAMLSSHSQTIKSVIENMVSDFLKNDNVELDYLNGSDEQSASTNYKIRKSDCTMPFLLNWYARLKPSSSYKCEIKLQNGNVKKVNKPPLVIIMRDIESYDNQVLQRFLSILSIYINEIPLVVIFGVATSLSMIHKCLSHCMISKLAIRIFQSQPSVVFLNSVLEKVFLTSECPFQLSGKVFQYLTDTFLFYDFSVSTFIKGIQFALMDHFYYSNLSVLCAPYSSLPKIVHRLTESEVDDIFQLLSSDSHSESSALIKRSKNAKDEILKLLKDFHIHVARFHMTVRCLHSLVKDLPHNPLGKHVREVYVRAMEMNIVDSAEFKTCLNLLSFFSKDELSEHLNTTLSFLSEMSSTDQTVSEVWRNLKDYKEKIAVSCTDKIVTSSSVESDHSSAQIDLQVKKRSQLRQKLLENVNHRDSYLNEFEKVRIELIDYLSRNLFTPFLKPPTSLVLHELFIFDNISAMRLHIDGKPRASVQTALQDPCVFLQCDCCKLTDKRVILNSMPDTCIAYKLHLECGTLINLYDWLQSFAAIFNIDNNHRNDEDNADTNYISPEIQARFWQSVSELQLMGFIQPSKKKVDHVERLTFDGN